MKNVDNYASWTNNTAVYPGVNTGRIDELAYLALGLTGEAGEAADCVKKILRSPSDIDLSDIQKEKLRGELGDLAYYWARMCLAIGEKPSDILASNIAKLEARKAEGTLKRR